MRTIEKKVGILRRIFDAILNAMHESRRRQAEREIASFVALQGGHVTDGLEREMTRRRSTSDCTQILYGEPFTGSDR
jgi:hypothetical protein